MDNSSSDFHWASRDTHPHAHATPTRRATSATEPKTMAALREHGVIPDVLPEATAPTVDLHVRRS